MSSPRSNLESLRQVMSKNGISAWVDSGGDSHLSEYVAEHWKSREWLSGFSGSSGTLVVTKDESLLWTDGRYFVQAERELAGSGIKLMKMSTPGFPAVAEWLAENLAEGSVLGMDLRLISADNYRKMVRKFEPLGIEIRGDLDLAGLIWNERPSMPCEPVFVHELMYSGLTAKEKIKGIRDKMQKHGIGHYLLSALDCIAWLCNIRGGDIQNNPFVIAYMRIGSSDAELFVDKRKLGKEAAEHLLSNGIKITAYEEVLSAVQAAIKDSVVAYDARINNAALINALPKSCATIEKDDFVTKAKAIKSEAEIENLKRCHARDGAVMVRFLMWLEGKREALANAPEPGVAANNPEKAAALTELDIADKLRQLRAEAELSRGESFDTIAAYGPNAAMMHYKATPSNYSELRAEGLLLVDCGGQYLDGTTDITRTVALGPIKEEERRACTLTLQSHIGLAKAVFLDGSTGSSLDILARLPMWSNGMDYKCGTGHGVGYFLSVHEGPHAIRQTYSPTKLEPGMVVTNEPGVYRSGKFGVRTENIMLVLPAFTTEDGVFYKMQPLTCCPIDTTTIELSALSVLERKWLNEYHAFVFSQVSPLLTSCEAEWLGKATAAV